MGIFEVSKIIGKNDTMPIFFEKQINDHSKIAIWKITEGEEFFLKHVPIQSQITHPHKRLQHLAGRYLLKYLFPHFPSHLIKIADTRKPFLEDEDFHFSISHCGDYAAAIISADCRVGIDVELATEKVNRISHKFTSVSEAALNLPPVLTWSCKEAIFKWYGKGGMDFKEDMELVTAQKNQDGFEVQALLKKEKVQQLHLHVMFFENLCLSYLFTEV